MKKKALLVIDVQNAMVASRDLTEYLSKIDKMISIFKQNKDEIIFVKYVDFTNEDSIFYHTKKENTELHLDSEGYRVFVKSKPNAFSNKGLLKYLIDNEVEQIVIVGFNIEYSCMFTAIVAEHENFDVTLIEDACGTVNDDKIYEMPGLDVNDFVGTVLNWSECIKVLYYDEFIENS